MNSKAGKKLGLLLLVAVQVLFLLGVASSYHAISWFGTEIKLKTVPVDPRDLFYGDYVILNYEISDVPASIWKGESLPDYGDKIYIVLRAGAKAHQLAAAYPSKPADSTLGADEVVISARTQYKMVDSFRVQYGLERYYIPEGTGQELEERREGMVVHAKVAPWGAVKIVSLQWEKES